jgi:hypothetical protein
MPTPHEKELSDLEKLLAALPPRPATLDRDRLLFRAGQESMRRSWVWPFAAVTMSVACGCLAMLLVLRPLPEPAVQIVHVHVPAPAAPAASDLRPVEPHATTTDYRQPPSPPLSYWRMQQQALRFGVEGLPQVAAAGDETSVGDVIHGPDLSAGSRPRLINHSAYPYGEP